MPVKLGTILAAAALAAVAAPSFVAPAFAQGAPPAAAPAPAPQPGVAVRVRGTINSFANNVLNFTTREGETIDITLAPDFRVSAAVPLTLRKTALRSAGSRRFEAPDFVPLSYVGWPDFRTEHAPRPFSDSVHDTHRLSSASYSSAQAFRNAA